MSRHDAETTDIPQPFAAVTMCDPGLEPAKFKSEPAARLHLEFHDCDSSSELKTATELDARNIIRFWRENRNMNFVAQCEAGCGRSHAVLAAICELSGRPSKPVRQHGTYNRGLYAEIMKSGGIARNDDPLVSVVVRVKYPADRLESFLLSMRRQRYENFELIVVTDGPQLSVRMLCESESWTRHLETEKSFGRWGHPHRQIGIETATGEYICLANDDNYLTPGFIEQLVMAMEDGADMAVCGYASKYAGYDAIAAGTEIGQADINSWMARASLVKANPFTGIDFDSDGKYVQLIALKANRVEMVDRVLMVKN